MEAQQLQYDNPRSALVIAVAAAEVGTKRCLQSLNPVLTEMLQSDKCAPMLDLLERYYPKEGAARVSPFVAGELKKVVFERNRLVHVGIFTLKRASLRQRLRAIEDLVRLFDVQIFDVQMGHEWAQRFLSEKTRAELDLHKLDPP